MKKRAFTLVECVVASLIVLIILGTLAVAVKFFVEGSRRIELRSNVLMIASSEMSTWEQAGYPELGEISRSENIGTAEFSIFTSVTELSPDIRELVVSVTGSKGTEMTSFELVRRFHE
jgi:type II secretory pathway pseudopilin PulG